jgi:HNH endonuclease
MDMTAHELAGTLDPPLSVHQVRTLAWLAGIEPSGCRRVRRAGRPARTYDADAMRRAHAQEAARTRKQFTDNDWVASALLDRQLIQADTDAGELRWPDGSRAERLRHDFYGYVKVPSAEVGAHRIIWIAAEGEIPPGLQVNHRNRLRWDNPRPNLELVTFGHNIRHAQLAMLPEPLPEVPCMDSMRRAGGVFRA